MVFLKRAGVGFAFYPVLANLERFEERAELKIVTLGDGIVLVIVAVRAVKGEAEESLARMFHDVAHPLVGVKRIPVSYQITGRHARVIVLWCNFVGCEHLA